MTIKSTGPNRQQRALNSQFMAWFSPTAQRARYVRVRRVIAILHAFIHFAEAGRAPWAYGKPLGLASPLPPLTTFREHSLATTYVTLGIQVAFATENKGASLPRLTLEEARSIIIGNYCAPLVAPAEPEDDDNLLYGEVEPDYARKGCNHEGDVITRGQYLQEQEMANLDDAMDEDNFVQIPPPQQDELPAYARQEGPMPPSAELSAQAAPIVVDDSSPKPLTAERLPPPSDQRPDAKGKARAKEPPVYSPAEAGPSL
jgi:hypothetical protein